MEIIIGKTAGFCFGVSNAVNKATQLLNSNRSIYCLGELVHNKQVTKKLESSGLKFIEDIIEAKENVIIRSHGVTKEIYQKAQELNLSIKDLTCPKVLKIHNIATQYSNKDFYILLVGHKEHPETIGTISFCGKNSSILQNENEIEEKLEEFYNTKLKNLLIIAQTTFSLEKFNEIVSIIEQKTKNKKIQLEIKNTICNATKLRQEETKKIAEQVDYMIIIGGKHSSNTTKLYQISQKYCKECVLAETKEDIDIEYVKKLKKIGIMAGASTPQESIKSIVEILN